MQLILSVFLLVAVACAAEPSASRKRIADSVGAIRLIDTHEHIVVESERNKRELSLFNLLHYVSSDMWADGMDRTSSNRLSRTPPRPWRRSGR